MRYGSEFHLVVRGAVSNIMTNLFGSLVSLISSLLLAKYFGSSVVGTIAIISAILSIAHLFSNIGFSFAMVRLIPEYRQRYGIDGAYALYRKTLKIRLVFMALTTVAFYLALDTVSDAFFTASPFPIRHVLMFAGVLVFVGGFYSFNLQSIRALKKVAAYNVLELLPRVMLLLLLGAVIVWAREPLTAIYAKLLGDLLSGLLSIVLVYRVWKGFSPARRFVLPDTVRTLLLVALPYFLTNLLYVVKSQADILMIGSMLDENAAGVYQVASKIVLVMLFVIQGVGLMAGPTISELFHAKKMPQLQALMRRSSTLLSVVLFPMLLLLMLFGESILGFFGDEFRRGYLVMVIMALDAVVMGWYALTSMMMSMSGDQGALTRFLLLSLSVNVLLNLLLIPIYGIEGAAFATLIGTLTLNILASAFIDRHYGFTAFPIGSKS